VPLDASARIFRVAHGALLDTLVPMNLVTLEVELDHGRVTPKGSERLPEKASALLTILPERVPVRDPLSPDPLLQRVRFHEDAAQPLEPEDWPEPSS
jgi:hypothetical protein